MQIIMRKIMNRQNILSLKSICHLGLFIATALTCFAASAGCQNVQPANFFSTSVDSLSVTRETSIGSVVYTDANPAGGNKFADSCTGTYFYTIETQGTRTPVGNNIFSTGSSEGGAGGIGFRVKIDGSVVNNDSTVIRTSAVSPLMSPQVTIEILKTGTVTPGWINGNLFDLYLHDDNGNKYRVGGYNFFTTVKEIGCDFIGSSSISVPMPPVSNQDFDGIGSESSKTANVNIRLTCSANTPVFFRVFNNEGRNNIIPVSSDSEAKGLGIRLAMNGQDLDFNTSYNIVNTTREMDVTIPLQARYVQTDEQITGGELKATAAFVIQYN